MPMIDVAPDLAIDESEIVVSFTRAGGPGGQNVNKVESAVHLRFDVAASPNLDIATKRRLAQLAGSRMTTEGVLVVFAQRFRSQERNKEDARARLLALIAEAAAPLKYRVKTRPTLAAKRRRVDVKTRRGETKKLRGRPLD